MAPRLPRAARAAPAEPRRPGRPRSGCPGARGAKSSVLRPGRPAAAVRSLEAGRRRQVRVPRLLVRGPRGRAPRVQLRSRRSAPRWRAQTRGGGSAESGPARPLRSGTRVGAIRCLRGGTVQMREEGAENAGAAVVSLLVSRVPLPLTTERQERGRKDTNEHLQKGACRAHLDASAPPWVHGYRGPSLPVSLGLFLSPPASDEAATAVPAGPRKERSSVGPGGGLVKQRTRGPQDGAESLLWRSELRSRTSQVLLLSGAVGYRAVGPAGPLGSVQGPARRLPRAWEPEIPRGVGAFPWGPRCVHSGTHPQGWSCGSQTD